MNRRAFQNQFLNQQGLVTAGKLGQLQIDLLHLEQFKRCMIGAECDHGCFGHGDAIREMISNAPNPQLGMEIRRDHPLQATTNDPGDEGAGPEIHPCKKSEEYAENEPSAKFSFRHGRFLP